MKNNETLRVNETFLSFQGESLSIGIPMFFIRFSGCNLNCDFCDTEFENYKEYTPSQLCDLVKNNKTDYTKIIALTGGEPLLQSGDLLFSLMNKLYWNQDYRFLLETNATLAQELAYILRLSEYELPKYIYTISADIKTDKYGNFMNEVEENQLEFFRLMAKNFHNNTLKIVIQPEMVDYTNSKPSLFTTLSKSLSYFSEKNVNISLTPLTGVNGEITHFSVEDLLNIYSQVYRAVFTNNINADIRVIPQTHRILDIK